MNKIENLHTTKDNILFIQGGGEEGYIADSKLAASLQDNLGDSYAVKYPKLQMDETSPDFGWLKQIGKEISLTQGQIILAGHSLGASMLLKYLSENDVKKKILGVFLISTPFWSGNEDWVQGLKLQEGFADGLPKNIPIFLYHCCDDKIIPSSHLSLYRQMLPSAIFREIVSGGHQFNNDLTIVAKDIKSLKIL